MRNVALPACVFMLVACANIGDEARSADGAHGWLSGYEGVYRGSFASALTEDPDDDLNRNPCDPRKQDCRTHGAPLVDVLLELERDAEGELRLHFFRSSAARDAGRSLDLLGAGCMTRLGPASRVQPRVQGSNESNDTLEAVVTFPLEAENRLCLGRLRPTSAHQLELELHRQPDTGARFVEPAIDRKVTDTNYLFVRENGVKRRVRIDLDNTLGEGADARYRVCIENDLGEYERCVLTDKEFRRFALPVPLPNGVAVNYTWWQTMTPQLRRTSGRYSLERYRGHFEPIRAR